MKKFILISLALLLSASMAQAATSKTLLETGTTWDGEKIAYPQGEAFLSAYQVEVDKGESTAFHCHPMPTFGQVLTGSIEVETLKGEKKTFHKGEAVAEIFGRWHRGNNLSKMEKTSFIVFYTGVKDQPTTIPYTEENKHLCKE